MLGYAWQICVCKQCNNHIGWKFTCVEPNLKPEKFWGLTRKSIRYTYSESKVEAPVPSSQTPGDTPSQAGLSAQISVASNEEATAAATNNENNAAS
jgi:hypothetical protein